MRKLKKNSRSKRIKLLASLLKDLFYVKVQSNLHKKIDELLQQESYDAANQR